MSSCETSDNGDHGNIEGTDVPLLSYTESSEQDQGKVKMKSVTSEDRLDSSIEIIYQRVASSKQGNDILEDKSDSGNSVEQSTRKSIQDEAQVTKDARMTDLSQESKNISAIGAQSAMSPALLSQMINNSHMTELCAPRFRKANLGGTQTIETPGQDLETPSREKRTDMQPTKAPEDPRLKRIKEKTESGIEEWTNGMIKTSYLDVITKKIDEGAKWITITGNAGDGKTTAGYMVLEEMIKRGKEVFHVKEPDQYYIVTENLKGAVLMLNDVLGAFDFDPTAWNKWESVIHDALDNTAKSREAGHHSNVTVIFISRWNVLQGGTIMLGKYGDDILDAAVVTDLRVHASVVCERVQILDYHLNRMHITGISKQEKEDVTTDMSPHGFPHCCKMYAELKTKDIKIKDFFSRPLQFLNDTTKVLCENGDNEILFKQLLLAKDGKLDVNNIESETLRQQVTSLTGSYLSVNCGIVKFSHPSICESVALCIGTMDVAFAIDQFRLSFLMQKMKFLGTPTSAVQNCNFIWIQPNESNIERLCKRFSVPLLNRHFDVLQHDIFLNEKLCERIILLVTVERTQHFFCCLMPQADFNKLQVDETDMKKNTLLHIAARCDNQTAIRILLKHGAGVNKRNAEGLTPLLILCRSESADTESVNMLMKYGTNVNKADNDGLTPLHYLCKNKSVDGNSFEILLKYGADVNRIDAWLERTPLHYLCANKKATGETIDILLKHGADANETDIYKGRTPLHYLCTNENTDRNKIDMLLTHKADVNIDDEEGLTSLHCLCRNGKVDENNISLLLQHGANVNTADKRGNISLHCLCANTKADQNTIGILLKHGADVNRADARFGCTPLQLLCENEKIDESTIDMLIKQGADVNKADKKGQTSLHFLCRNKEANSKTFDILLKHEAQVNKPDRSRGITPFHYLCANWKSDEGIIDMLLRHGADVNKANKNEFTPFHFLCMNENSNRCTIDMMLRHGADVNKADEYGHISLHYLCLNEKADSETINMLLKHGTDVNKTGFKGCTPFHYLCSNVIVDGSIINIMMKHGADVNKANEYRCTPLHNLCQNKKVDGEAINILLQHEAHVNIAETQLGWTPLHILCLNEKADGEAINILLQHGADVNIADTQWGWTPLHILCLNDKTDVGSISLLLKHGADTNIVDCYTQTPLDYISDKQVHEAVTSLQK